MHMYLQKVISGKFKQKIVFCWVLKVNDENTRIWIQIHYCSQMHGSADPDPHQNALGPELCF